MNRRLGWEIERLILGTLIILGILDFAGFLPPFLAYVMDIVGWTTIAYIIYVISPTEILFGNRHGGVDFSIVLAYAIMSVKDLIGNAAATLPQLIASSPSYVRFKIADAGGVPFTITQEELNSYQLFHVVPNRVVEAVASHLTMTQQQFSLLLVNGDQTVGLVAQPMGTNGMMLMYYNTLVANAAAIQKASLIIGAGILLAVSIYAAYRIPIKGPSVLSVLKEEGPATPWRVVIILLMLMAFFVMVFNLLFEWMTITNDAPLIALAVIAFGFLFLVHAISMSFDEVIERLGSLGDEFYAKVLHLFMESRTILLGVSGFLVLHLLTDVGNYVAPAIFGWYKTIYVANTPGDHTPLYLMIRQVIGADPLHNALVILVYVLSVLGIIMLLSLPAVIWYKLFKLRTEGHHHLPDWKGWQVGLVMACIAVFLITPVFTMSALRGTDIVGVNITARTLDTARITLSLGVAAGVFLLCALIGLHDYARRVLMLGPFAAAGVFFGVYVFSYFTSSFVYYATLLVRLVRGADFWIIPIIFLLFGLTIVFFVTGFLSFLYEIWRD